MKIVSLATRKKMGKSQKGKKFPADKYPNYGMRGKKQKQETIEKIRNTQKGVPRPWMLGDKNVSKRPEVRLKIRKAKKGKPLSKKNIEGIIKALTGNPKISGENSVTKRPEVRAKIKKSKEKLWRDPNSIYNSLEYRQKNSGSNCHLWRGGIGFEPYTPEFNKQLKLFIRTRDNFTCQFPDCGLLENGHKHSVHHINYNKKDCKPEKLILLCRSHNSVVNFNREHWKTYFQELMKGMCLHV